MEDERLRVLNPLLARISRTARAALQQQRHRSMPLIEEQAQLIVRSRSLLESCKQQVQWSGGLFSKASAHGLDRTRPLQLSGSLSLGPASTMETTIQATSLQLMEVRVRLTHLRLADFIAHNGRIAVTGATDLESRHRLTLESMIGSEEERHSLSNVVSADSTSSLSWGVGTSHKVNAGLTAFSRFSSDKRSGERFILQAVHKVGMHTVSPICSVTSKGSVQAGVTWKSSLQSRGGGGGKEEDFFQVRALWSQNGVYSFHVKAHFGVIDGGAL